MIFLATVTMATESFRVREMGVQCYVGKNRVNHHQVVETVKVFKEGDAEVTTKRRHDG